jgi:hypothetical protein
LGINIIVVACCPSNCDTNTTKAMAATTKRNTTSLSAFTNGIPQNAESNQKLAFHDIVGYNNLAELDRVGNDRRS